MSSEPELAARVAAVERRLGDCEGRVKARGVVRGLGATLLATLLTANAWILWRGFQTLAAGRVQQHFWVICQGGATEEQRRQAFTELIRAGNREWRSARLDHLALRGGTFDRADLRWANMEGCDLTQATLMGARMRGVNLKMARLVRANLSLAELSEAVLLKADLTGATVRGARLRSASLEQAQLSNADFEGSDLSEANLLMAVLANTTLRRADLSSCNLDAADLTGADLEGANLEHASTRDANFANSNWWRAVGLPAEAIDRFKDTFAPASAAPSELRADYTKWLADGSAPAR